MTIRIREISRTLIILLQEVKSHSFNALKSPGGKGPAARGVKVKKTNIRKMTTFINQNLN